MTSQRSNDRELSGTLAASQQTMRTARVLCLFCAVLRIAQPQPAGSGAIAGTVVEASTGDPVRKAVVTVTWHGTPRSWATTRTDGSGGFRFDGLPPGLYDLRAAKPAFGVAIYGANSLRETGETITLADAETRAGLKLRFIRSASISGIVTGPEGDPAVNTQVMLLRATRNNGQPVLQSVRRAQTDDRGEYHMVDVAPGQYSVFANPQVQPLNGSEAVASQFYGGARDAKDSTVVGVRDGDHLRGIDFHLISEPAVRIRGHVLGVPEQPAPPQNNPPSRGPQRPRRIQYVQVGIWPLSFNPNGFNRGAGGQSPDYKFEFDGLPPGEYELRATMQIDGKTYSASQVVDARAGAGDVTLMLTPPVEVKGQLKIEGQAAGQQIPINITLMQSRGNVGSGFGSNAGRVGPDGKFTFAPVPPGEYTLNILTMPRGSFLKSVHFGDDDVRFKTIEIKPGSEAALNIVISMHGAKIEGQVDAGDGDAGRAAILVAPVGELHQFARFYYSVAADDHGKFRLLGLAPGKYRIFALEKLAPAPLRTSEVADQLNALDGDYAQEIELVEDGSVEAHPKLIPLERGRAVLP